MARIDRLSQFTVKVNNGSGCLFQPETNEYTYVLTAKHVIKEDKEPNITRQMLGNDDNRHNQSLNIIAKPLLHENKDAAIIKVEFIEGIKHLVRAENLNQDNFDFHLTGHPLVRRDNNQSDRSTIRYDRIYMLNQRSRGIREAQLKQSTEHKELVGQSGGGVIAIDNDKYVLIGILTELAEPEHNENLSRVNLMELSLFDEILEKTGNKKLHKSVFQRESINANLGHLVSKCCARSDQEDEFYKFRLYIERKVQDIPKLPKICIIHGDDGENHESLVERFRHTHIQSYAEKTYSKNDAVINFKEIRKQSMAPDLRTRKAYLFEQLFQLWKTHPKEYDNTKIVAQLGKLLETRKEKILVIQHNLDLPKVDKLTSNLLKDYLGFWKDVAKYKIPEVFLFFNISYGYPPASSWFLLNRFKRHFFDRKKERISQSLQNDLGLASGSITTDIVNQEIILTILDEVHPTDVKNWFKEHKIYQNKTQEEKEEMIRKMFKTNKGKMLKCRRMGDIEPKLQKIVNSLSPEIK